MGSIISNVCYGDRETPIIKMNLTDVLVSVFDLTRLSEFGRLYWLLKPNLRWLPLDRFALLWGVPIIKIKLIYFSVSVFGLSRLREAS